MRPCLSRHLSERPPGLLRILAGLAGPHARERTVKRRAHYLLCCFSVQLFCREQNCFLPLFCREASVEDAKGRITCCICFYFCYRHVEQDRPGRYRASVRLHAPPCQGQTSQKSPRMSISRSLCDALISDPPRQDHNLNPFTKKPHTTQYKTILETRKKLPVYGQMEEFLEIVCPTVIFDMRRAVEFCSL